MNKIIIYFIRNNYRNYFYSEKFLVDSNKVILTNFFSNTKLEINKNIIMNIW